MFYILAFLAGLAVGFFIGAFVCVVTLDIEEAPRS